MIGIFVLTCVCAQAAEFIYLKKPIIVHCHSIDAVLFQGERVMAEKTSGGWLVSGVYGISADGRLMHTDIKSLIPAGVLADKKVNVKTGGKYTFTGFAASSITSRTLNQAVSDWGDVYYERCSTCHKAYEASDYPCKRWPSILESMKVQAGLSPAEKRLILRYLQLKSRASKNTSPLYYALLSKSCQIFT